MFRGMPRRGGSMERPCDPEVARLHGAATAESAAELGVEAAGGSSLLGAAVAAAALAGRAAAVALTVPARGAVKAARGALAVAARRLALHGAGGLLQGGGHHLGGQVEVLAQEVNAGVRQKPVVVAPGKALGDQLPGLEALHELDDLQVGHIQLRVLRQVEVLLGVQHALIEEELVHLAAVLLGDQHGDSSPWGRSMCASTKSRLDSR
mmetsp:Transcript_2475/g.6261  ORF Transcript_2475/g.6261 Transcript_2475/m.6261 type:complete len:208 (-) Transcript_2475:50-673(-)